MKSGPVAVKAVSTRTGYHRGRAVLAGRYEINKSLSELLEARAEASLVGLVAELGLGELELQDQEGVRWKQGTERGW